MNQNTTKQSSSDLLAFIKKTNFFKDIDESTLQAFASNFQYISLNKVLAFDAFDEIIVMCCSEFG